MAKKFYEESNIAAIASAIRAKAGTSDFYKVVDMADAIEEIEFNNDFDFRKVAVFQDNIINVVGSYAFHFCSVLSQINLPKVTTIGSYAFANCDVLSQISLPEVITIGSYAFQSCPVLSQVSLPKVTTMYVCAFCDCPMLSQISLPKITNIKGYTFQRCYTLISLYLMSPTMVTLNDIDAFSSTPISTYTTVAGRYGSIYVPASLLNTYKTATNWSQYAARFVGI